MARVLIVRILIVCGALIAVVQPATAQDVPPGDSSARYVPLVSSMPSLTAPSGDPRLPARLWADALAPATVVNLEGWATAGRQAPATPVAAKKRNKGRRVAGAILGGAVGLVAGNILSGGFVPQGLPAPGLFGAAAGATVGAVLGWTLSR